MQVQDLVESHPNIIKARAASAAVLKSIADANPHLPKGVSIVLNGSLARGEITSKSDLDAYPLYAPGQLDAAKSLLSEVQKGAKLREFAAEGAFGEPVPASSMHTTIGGQGDDNKRFTRRMLLLLESSSIGDSAVYETTLDRVILRYLSDDMTNKQIGRFLLNDIIRFYRTMCVDFEFKTVEEAKPWGIRYAKLIFSRKLIYYSGVITCASLAGLTPPEKRAQLRRLCSMPPIDRLLSVLGDAILPALSEYEYFLSQLDDKNIRDELAKVEIMRATHTDVFKAVKARGHVFSSLLVDVVRTKYDVSHPIREALIV